MGNARLKNEVGRYQPCSDGCSNGERDGRRIAPASTTRPNSGMRLWSRECHCPRCADRRQRLLVSRLPEAVGKFVHLHRFLSQRRDRDQGRLARISGGPPGRPLARGLVLYRLRCAGHLTPRSIPGAYRRCCRVLLGSRFRSSWGILLGIAASQVVTCAHWNKPRRRAIVCRSGLPSMPNKPLVPTRRRGASARGTAWVLGNHEVSETGC
jgi:hypothetical protein